MQDSKNIRIDLPQYSEAVKKAANYFTENNILKRILKKDYTVWKNTPDEISNRLGWLDTIVEMQQEIDTLHNFVHEVQQAGYTTALLLGMGGSSLAPEVFRRTFGVKPQFLDLHVLDSTDPDAVYAIRKECDPSKTLYIVSTKSGTTVETLSFMKYFYRQALDDLGENEVGNHFIAITDPGSNLECLARELKFRKIFINNPDIGGRYSALSYFGLVPAALLGIDIKKLLNRAQHTQATECSVEEPDERLSVRLGIIMGVLAKKGIDKLTFILSSDLSYFGIWVEQLIAESTGKEGKGILPVVGESVLDPGFYAADRLFIYLKTSNNTEHDKNVSRLVSAGFPVIRMEMDDVYDMGCQYFIWELATAIAGWILQINPFDQPNVESAKKVAKKLVASYKEHGQLPRSSAEFESDGISLFGKIDGDSMEEILSNFLKSAHFEISGTSPRSYIAIQAYLKPDDDVDQILSRLALSLHKKYKLAVTVGYGPRFLHSTGQLHKGDSGNGLFIQIAGDNQHDLNIPDSPYENTSAITFGILKTAQYLGDYQALKDAGREVIRLDLGSDTTGNLRKIVSIFSS